MNLSCFRLFVYACFNVKHKKFWCCIYKGKIYKIFVYDRLNLGQNISRINFGHKFALPINFWTASQESLFNCFIECIIFQYNQIRICSREISLFVYKNLHVITTHDHIDTFKYDRFPNLNSHQLWCVISWFAGQSDIFLLSNIYFYVKTHLFNIFLLKFEMDEVFLIFLIFA